ncbi:MAG: SDR family oxidoreductase [Prochlorotrichaceae cyanobacterium]|jgi:short-subunit dehydrogenase
MSSLTRKRCLITGASSGIGKATALAFAQQDSFDLVLLGRSRSKLDRVAEEINRLGTAIYALDFAEVDQILPAIRRIEQETGSWDILINSAGMGYTGTIAETPLQDWQTILNLNLTSVFQCVQAVLPGMRQRGAGHIINVASVAAQQVFPQWGPYCVSKAALLTLSKAIAVEERSQGIRVTTICPGAVNTPLWDTEVVQADFDRSKMLTPEVVAQSILQVALLPPEAVVEELTIMPSAGAL